MLVSVQVTPLEVASFATVAVNAWLPARACTVAECSERVTEIGAIVMAAEPVTVGLAMDVAVTKGVSLGAAGAVVGGV